MFSNYELIAQVSVCHLSGAGEFGPSVFSISERQGVKPAAGQLHLLLPVSTN